MLFIYLIFLIFLLFKYSRTPCPDRQRTHARSRLQSIVKPLQIAEGQNSLYPSPLASVKPLSVQSGMCVKESSCDGKCNPLNFLVVCMAHPTFLMACMLKTLGLVWSGDWGNSWQVGSLQQWIARVDYSDAMHVQVCFSLTFIHTLIWYCWDFLIVYQ